MKRELSIPTSLLERYSKGSKLWLTRYFQYLQQVMILRVMHLQLIGESVPLESTCAVVLSKAALALESSRRFERWSGKSESRLLWGLGLYGFFLVSVLHLSRIGFQSDLSGIVPLLFLPVVIWLPPMLLIQGGRGYLSQTILAVNSSFEDVQEVWDFALRLHSEQKSYRLSNLLMPVYSAVLTAWLVGGFAASWGCVFLLHRWGISFEYWPFALSFGPLIVFGAGYGWLLAHFLQPFGLALSVVLYRRWELLTKQERLEF